MARNVEASGKTNAMKHITTLLFAAACCTAQAQVTHDLHAMDYQFVPSALTISLGDHIHIILDDPDHTFTQVDQTTWMANGTTPLGGGYNYGYGTPNPGTDFTITPTGLGTIYYVCQVHVAQHGMKGTIAVISGTGIETPTMPEIGTLAPNPATERVQLISDAGVPVVALFYDVSGKRCMTASTNGHEWIALDGLNSGLYTVELRSPDMTLLARQRLAVQ